MLSRRHAFMLLPLALAVPRVAGGTAAPVVLTIQGRLRDGQARSLSLDDLGRLPQRSFTTNTPWTKEPHRYTGPLLRDVLDAVGAQGSQLRATALNDYRVVIPVEDARQHDVIIAVLVDGNPLPVRSRGPLFVIYPFDEKPELRKGAYYERSIWQLRSIEIE
jgi:hypothetical protein